MLLACEELADVDLSACLAGEHAQAVRVACLELTLIPGGADGQQVTTSTERKLTPQRWSA